MTFYVHEIRCCHSANSVVIGTLLDWTGNRKPHLLTYLSTGTAYLNSIFIIRGIYFIVVLRSAFWTVRRLGDCQIKRPTQDPTFII